MAQSFHYDPTSGMITMYKDLEFSNTSGAALRNTCGLEDYNNLNDVKVKILSIEYKVKAFTDNVSPDGATPADNNLYAFNNESRQAGGSFVFGVCNRDESSTLDILDDFEGTSAWPVHITSWVSQIGLPASTTKTWRPDKLALSDQQVAFITVKNNSGVHNTVASYAWASVVIRAIRI